MMPMGNEYIPATMYVDLKKHRLALQRSTFEAIQNPTYIQLLIDTEVMAVAVLGLDQEMPGDQSHRVIERRLETRRDYEIYSKNFTTQLCDLIGDLDETGSYHIPGCVIPGQRLAIYALEAITRID